MRTINKTLTFPLSGISRKGAYRKQTRPYSTPWAVNTRGVCNIEQRNRGGSRPGLSKVLSDQFTDIVGLFPVTSVNEDNETVYNLIVIANGSFFKVSGGVASVERPILTTCSDESILTEDGDEIIFDSTVSATSPVGNTGAYNAVARAGKLYLADNTLKSYNPITGAVDDVSAPSGEPLITVYRDRIILAGKNHLWYASAVSSPTDWDFGKAMEDESRAVAGQLSHAGKIGTQLTTVIPVDDRYLIFASENNIWVLDGDPTTGRIRRVTSEVGIISPQSWAMDNDGKMCFLSNKGVYMWQAGVGSPFRFSIERIPDELINCDTTNKITMGYDPAYNGFHLFITPTTGSGIHWWIDIENKAFWAVTFPESMQPVATSRNEDGGGLSEIIIAGSDGYLRKFSTSSTDDGTAIPSHLLIGPFRISSQDVKDAMLVEIHGLLADIDSSVEWGVFLEDTAEKVVDISVTGLNASLSGSTVVEVKGSGSWTQLRNKVSRPRARGSWCVVWIHTNNKWAYEAVAIVARQLGRLR